MVQKAIPYAYGCTICVYAYGMYHTRSLAWPDPIFAQGVYRLQYKHPHEKGLEQFTESTGSDTS